MVISIGLLRAFSILILTGCIGSMIIGSVNFMQFLTFNDESVDGEVGNRIKSRYFKNVIFYFMGAVAGWGVYFLFAGV